MVYKDIIDYDSYSFPSGHTTMAYFLFELLSHFYPGSKKDLKNLAELIGQSRIENCVHYPSDVLHGQLLGEMLSSIFLEKGKEEKCHELKGALLLSSTPPKRRRTRERGALPRAHTTNK